MSDNRFQPVEIIKDIESCGLYCQHCGEEDNIEIVQSCHVYCRECRQMSQGCGD